MQNMLSKYVNNIKRKRQLKKLHMVFYLFILVYYLDRKSGFNQ